MRNHTGNKKQRLVQFLYVLSLVFLGIGLFSLGWAHWPTPIDGVQLNVPAGGLAAAPGEDEFISLSEYSLNVSWPRRVRRGESGILELRLTDVDGASTADADATQIVLAEPVFFMLQVDPSGETQSALGDGQTLTLYWRVSGDQRGEFSGKLYVSFAFFVPTENVLVSVPVAVVDLDVQVIELWGLSSAMVTWLGVVNLVLWGAVFVLGRGIEVGVKLF
ncbi:MAG: hypothetical protein WAP13_02810 [Brevefilum fermentans]